MRNVVIVALLLLIGFIYYMIVGVVLAGLRYEQRQEEKKIRRMEEYGDE